ncbi:MAG TPA: M20/M25/M40 family metallo-hydrolase [Polyangia bacterium]|nr:M20/M25/M40 family metallo-hydrolase [Polyangia bacterium]
MALVDRLAELVSFDTQNPEGEERPLCHRLAVELGALGARSVDEVEVGDHAYVYARFGTELPRLVVNAHVDTVPANSGYSSPPHLLVRRGDRLHGLGTCDIKGAIAGVLEALATGPVNRSVGVLFSGDEERGGSCIRAFLDSEAARGLERAIVCEPTGCRVGIRHRGIGAATVTLEGPGGHSSLVDQLTNPVAVLARAAVALDDMGI